MNHRIIVPSRLTSTDIQTLMITYDEIHSSYKEVTALIFDLSNLQKVDTEGLNYIALLPFSLKLLNDNVKIILPTNDEIILFLEYTNLLNFYFDHFDVIGFPSIEDFMFLRNRIKANNIDKKVRIGLVMSQSFDSFLRNDLSNLERIINHHDYSNYFCRCFYELSKNIFDHSGENIGGFSFHFYPAGKSNCNRDVLLLTISDIGIGIKNSFNIKQELHSDQKDSFYIEEAIKPGITSTGTSGRGLGLYHVVSFSSHVKITSGNGQIKVHEGHLKSSTNSENYLKGTSIHIRVEM
jgi:hypothetical protein